MEELFYIKFVILKTFVNNTLSMLRINIPPIPLFLTDTVMGFLRKTMNTYEDVQSNPT